MARMLTLVYVSFVLFTARMQNRPLTVDDDFSNRFGRADRIAGRTRVPSGVRNGNATELHRKSSNLNFFIQMKAQSKFKFSEMNLPEAGRY